MKFLVALSAGFLVLQLNGQLTVTPLGEKQSGIQTFSSRVEKNSLPFWDDFSVTEDGRPDLLRIWGDDTIRQWGDSTKGVFVNSSLGKNPPSLKVVTFDGLDENGQIYANGNGLTDELYSDTLDLNAFTEEDNLIISFYWQAGGNVERPDSKDSIRLQFYVISADTAGGNPWQTVWTQNGSDELSDDIFFQEAIPVEQRFINEVTLFRFQAFGDQDGPFDAWHLDWIYLNDNRENDDFFYLDRGLTGQLTSPFSPFKSMPIHQFKNGPSTTGSQTLQTFNLDNNEQPAELILTLRDLDQNATIDSILKESVNPQAGNTDSRQITNTLDFSFDAIDLSTLPTTDSLVLESTVYVAESDDGFLQGTNINLRINDTIRTQYLLHDFLAFDDGTAEYAIGTNQQGDQIGVQYWVNEQDTITQIDMLFPNITPDSNGETLILRIFRNLEDQIPAYTESITVATASAPNAFTSYELNRPVIVSDTFYITYEQNVNQYISLGLDRSNDAASRYIFQNITGQWERNNRIDGAIMIRPVFKNVGDDFTLSTPNVAINHLVYPNPSQGLIRIEGSYATIELRNISGQLLRRESARSVHDFSGLSGGLYLLTIDDGTTISTQKIILK